MTSTTPTIERRHSDRRRACYGGSLRIAAFLPDVECRLRDHSLTGARIVVAEDVILPRVVELTVACRDQTRRAAVVWRRGSQAGLAFLDAVGPDVMADAATGGRAAAEPAAADVPLPGRLH